MKLSAFIGILFSVYNRNHDEIPQPHRCLSSLCVQRWVSPGWCSSFLASSAPRLFLPFSFRTSLVWGFSSHGHFIVTRQRIYLQPKVGKRKSKKEKKETSLMGKQTFPEIFSRLSLVSHWLVLC